MFSRRHRHQPTDATTTTPHEPQAEPPSSRAPLWTRALSRTPHPMIQPKLTVSQPEEAYEREADQIAGQVMRMADPAAGHGPERAPSGSGAGSRSGGQPLPEAARQFFEPRFGADFGDVRVHTGEQAAQAASSLNARAYTLGSDIVFGAGEYDPSSTGGQRLLAHELTHVVQQRSAPPMIQRDLSAYNKEKVDFMPNYGDPGMGSTTYTTISAEAPGIRSALSQLIADGKVSEIKSSSGNKSWFAANHHKNAQLADIEKAFSDAGYSDAGKLARSLYDIHGEYLYSNQTITTVTLFGDYSSSSGAKVSTERNRSLTEYEIRQARRVFKDAIKYNDVTIAEGSISAKIGSVGGYARTIGNTIYFPAGSTRSMALMIHELTHVWQYQTTGWTYAPKALWAQVAEGYSYTPEGKTADDALNEARAAGKTLTDFNKEQQGDILADYFRRLQKGSDTKAFDPFVNDVK